MLKLINAWIMIIILRSIKFLPYPMIANLGNFIGKILFHIPNYRRKIVKTNLHLCFPHLSKKELNTLAYKHFQHALRSFAERSIQWYGDIRKLEKLVTIETKIDLKDPNLPPTIFLGFHFVGIEAGAIFLNYSLQRHCGALYSPLSNPILDHEVRKQRSRFNSEIISRHSLNASRKILKMLKERKPVMLAADMDFGLKDSVFTPFFGIPASTLTAVGRLAKLSKAQVVPFFCEVLPNYKGYRLVVCSPWENFPSESNEENAKKMNDFVEQIIKKMPEQYYWMHRRFKTRPTNQPSFYI